MWVLTHLIAIGWKKKPIRSNAEKTPSSGGYWEPQPPKTSFTQGNPAQSQGAPKSQNKFRAPGNLEVEQGQFEQVKMPSFSSANEDNQEMIAPWDTLGPVVPEDSKINQEGINGTSTGVDSCSQCVQFLTTLCIIQQGDTNVNIIYPLTGVLVYSLEPCFLA